MSTLNLVTAAVGIPVSLEEAKHHMRVSTADDDALIQSDLESACERVEIETGRQLLTATWQLWLDSAPGLSQSSGGPDTGLWAGANAWMNLGAWWNRLYIDVPRPPLASVSSITYVDTAGVTQTWDAALYQVHKPAGPTAGRGKIRPAYGVSWPVTRDQMDAVVVQFTAGYGTSGDAVPQPLRRAILMIAGDLYENREATIVTDRRVTVEEMPSGVDRILQQYRARPVTRAA